MTNVPHLTIDDRLAALARHMSWMAANEMGDLTMAEAATFHAACSLIASLLDVRAENAQDREGQVQS